MEEGNEGVREGGEAANDDRSEGGSDERGKGRRNGGRNNMPRLSPTTAANVGVSVAVVSCRSLPPSLVSVGKGRKKKGKGDGPNWLASHRRVRSERPRSLRGARNHAAARPRVCSIAALHLNHRHS